MSEIVKLENVDLNQAEVDGKRLYNTNSFYRNLTNVMEHPEFRKFIDKGDDFDYFKTLILFIKSYQEIEKIRPSLNGYQKLSFLNSLIVDSNYRAEIVRLMSKWMKNVENKTQLKIEN